METPFFPSNGQHRGYKKTTAARWGASWRTRRGHMGWWHHSGPLARRRPERRGGLDLRLSLMLRLALPGLPMAVP
jgi:hypothetical protein